MRSNQYVLKLYIVLYIVTNLNIAEFLQLVHRDWPSEHGNLYRGWAGTRSIVCVTSPEFMEVLFVL